MPLFSLRPFFAENSVRLAAVRAIRRFGWVGLLLAGMLLGTIAGAKPAWAAIQLAYFDPIAQADRVRVTWGATEEYDLLGYRVYCKREDKPDSAYHPIGGLISATGSLTTTADYSLDAFGLLPGVSYCFKLKEITSNGDPGEVFVRCGYGLNITPTPLPSDTPTVTPTPSETPTPTPLFSPTPTPTETPVPSPTPTDTPTVEPGSPTPPYVVYTATFTPTSNQPQATFTPLPTATPLAGGLFGLLGPGTGTPAPAPAVTPQTGLLGSSIFTSLLCLSTLGAGGLGLLSLLGGLFFVRSRRDDRVER